jgi:hypothetical protein
MAKNSSISISFQEREFLRRALEERIGMSIETDVDCQLLIEKIEKEYTSETEKQYIYGNKSLDRLLLKASYNEPFIRNNINLLCRFIGYKGWDDFQANIYHLPSIEEIFENQRKEIQMLLDHNIPNDSGVYLLGWYPAKYSKIKHVGGFEFKVVESKNMHKKPEDDTFITLNFTLSEELDRFGLPDIKLDDYGDGYFDEQSKDSGEVFDADYFYL